MTSFGLRKVGNFEDVLARVTKDEQYIDGTIAPGIQDYAKQIRNSPDFQKVKDRLKENLATQTRTHIEHVTYQNHVCTETQNGPYAPQETFLQDGMENV